MASCFISLSKGRRKAAGTLWYAQRKIKTAGGCPAASYFLLLRQNKVAKDNEVAV